MEPIQTEAKTVSNPSRIDYLLPLSIALAGVFIAVGLYLGMKSGEPIQPTVVDQNGVASKDEINIKPLSSDDHILGNPNAKILIVEFSDTECPFCKQFQTTLHKIMDTYGKNGDVAWIYRHFPIDGLHKKARKEAEATECAAELGGPDAFWNYLDEVYKTTPSNDGLDLAQLPVIAKNVGINAEKFNQCLSSGKYANKVEAQYQDAVAAGGQGTPYTVLVTKNGKLPITQGAIPYEQLASIIDQLLVSLK